MAQEKGKYTKPGLRERIKDRIMDLLEDIEDTKLAIERKDSIPMPITLEELAEL